MKIIRNSTFPAYDKGEPLTINGAEAASAFMKAYEHGRQCIGFKTAGGELIILHTEKDCLSAHLVEHRGVMVSKTTLSPVVSVMTGADETAIARAMGGLRKALTPGSAAVPAL